MERGASRTAVFVCQGRAVADGRLAVGRFHDPVAAALLDPEELGAVGRARSETSPPDWRARLAVEALRACAEVVVPRTVVVDDAIREADHRQVVLVGAGLDTRPWRLAELSGAVVFSVDHPASQGDARRRAAGLDPLAERLEWVSVDLARDGLDPALSRAGHDPSLGTTWVWEGVVPYLTAPGVERTVAAIAARSSAGSVLLVNYQSPSWGAMLGRRLAGVTARLAGLDDPLAGEPWRSLWTAARMRALLGRYGLAVRRDQDLEAIAAALGSLAAHRRSLRTGRVALATS